jgi:hypothetical protein
MSLHLIELLKLEKIPPFRIILFEPFQHIINFYKIKKYFAAHFSQ